MSLQLPESVRVQLQHEDGARDGLGNVLVALELRHDGRRYYGTLIGLTDASGTVATTAARIEREFAEDRRVFPMDCRVPLAECDSTLMIHISGGQSFLEMRAAACSQELTTPEAREMWRRAENARLRSATVEVAVRADGSALTVPILVQPA